ncbi:MAG: thiamine pyrophosphate-dependent dehydrogenase E1 component subunit alpha [Proteobacteria bacterium]|nr:thiamine pyrophosphate-dependent dehydrogenase E1 component subunit alpha [Pseudomonadota bacterium]MBU4288988.1 thiamine pyrophosphate-dependent dehydrogenase E1 component subunit alpha [Pseudomonadota bacterium]
MKLPRKTLLRLYYDMLRIHNVQLRIESLYHLDEMKTPIHLCIGQEAIAVGVCANLNKEDYISSSHRSHGHYLAKGGDLKGLIAELYCRETGCSKGRGGSMHIVDTSVGHMGSSSIVGGGIPIGTGLALAIHMKKQNRVSVVFLGDGAADEGVLYESINFAILKKLPVIYIYENNQFSVCSHISARQAGEIIFHATPPDYMFTKTVDGNAVLEVYEATREAAFRARNGQGPSFIECKTYRMRGHAGAGSDVRLGYRPAEEISFWESKCPVTTFREKLLQKGLISQKDVKDMEKDIAFEIDEAFHFAQESPLPKGEHILQYLLSE